MIMILPGGGYSSSARWNEGFLWIPYFHSKGYAVTVLEYRMPYQDHTIPMSDASEAINVLRYRADELGIDKNRIGVMGFSAGGHLASTIMVSDNDAIRPDYVMLFYPVVSMRKELTHMDSHNKLLGFNASKELEDKYSNELHVSRNVPPVFLVVAKDDSIVNPRNSIVLYNEMKIKGQSISFHLYPKGGHGWGYLRSFPYRDQMNTDMINWLDSLDRAFVVTP